MCYDLNVACIYLGMESILIHIFVQFVMIKTKVIYVVV